MKQGPKQLWTGGSWEQPTPRYTLPPVAPLILATPVTRPKGRRKGWVPFLTLLGLILLLSLSTLVIRAFWSREEESDRRPAYTHTRDDFADLERAETGTGTTVPISAQAGEALDTPEIYEKCVPSIVSIEAESAEEYSTGTGVVMTSDGYIITNAHVVAGAHSVRVILNDDRILSARLVGADGGEDLAVLKVDAGDLHPAEFGDSSTLRTGDTVLAIGDPLGYRASITQGIVSALDRTMDVDGVNMTLIQTSAPINFGNSGGALINRQGQVVGITTIKIISEDGGVEGLGFAIPMTRVKSIVDWLIAGSPTLGFTVDTRPLEKGGLTIRSVERGTPASKVGLRRGDVLLALNGAEVDSIETLQGLRNTLKVGESVTLTVLRSEERKELSFVVKAAQDIYET